MWPQAMEPPEAGRGKEGSSTPRPRVSADSHGPADAPVLDFWPPELQGNQFLSFKPCKLVVPIYRSPRTWVQGVVRTGC